MELEEFQLLERQLSHETGGPHARPLQMGVSPQGSAAKSPGLLRISQSDKGAEDAPSDDMMGQGSNSSNTSRIDSSLPSGNVAGSLFQHQVGLPHAPFIAPGSSRSSRRPASPEPTQADGSFDAAPQKRQQQQLAQQPGQAQVSAHLAASMTDHGKFQPPSSASAHVLPDWREQADWAGLHMHAAIASTVPGASMPHDRHGFTAASSPKLYGTLQDEASQQQRGNVAQSNVLHEGHAHGRWQTEEMAVCLDTGAMDMSGESIRQGHATQDLVQHGEKDCGMAGATQQVSCWLALPITFLLWTSQSVITQNE